MNDGSGAIVVRRDGRHQFSNLPTDTASGKTILHLGDRISTLTGIIYYSFNQYKVVPRGSADFGTITVGVEPEDGGILPEAYALSPELSESVQSIDNDRLSSSGGRVRLVEGPRSPRA
ncbi:MAG: hypothetical protein MZV64_29730 [Ignavibacteriales bacterium]|nr:hypothetical protein [Ignavibacteriales bacterium]